MSNSTILPGSSSKGFCKLKPFTALNAFNSLEKINFSLSKK